MNGFVVDRLIVSGIAATPIVRRVMAKMIQVVVWMIPIHRLVNQLPNLRQNQRRHRRVQIIHPTLIHAANIRKIVARQIFVHTVHLASVKAKVDQIVAS